MGESSCSQSNCALRQATSLSAGLQPVKSASTALLVAFLVSEPTLSPNQRCHVTTSGALTELREHVQALTWSPPDLRRRAFAWAPSSVRRARFSEEVRRFLRRLPLVASGPEAGGQARRPVREKCIRTESEAGLIACSRQLHNR